MTVTLETARAGLQATGALAEVVHPYQGGSHDFQIRKQGDESSLVLELGGEDYTLSRESTFSAINSLPGGTDTIAERWPLDLCVQALNFFFDHTPGDFKMLVDGEGNVRQFVKPNTLLFNPVTVLDAMADTMGQYGGKEHVEVKDFAHSLEETRFSVIVPAGQAERFVNAKPGDMTVGGLHFSGSLLGKGNPELAVFTDRVLCSNGMVQPAGSTRFRVGKGDEDADGPMEQMLEWLTTSCANLVGQPLTEEFARLEHLTHHVVDDAHVATTLADIFTRFRIASPAQSQIIEAMADEADGTMYGIVQAITRAAQHSTSLTDAQRFSLMARAGEVSYHAQSICDSCQRPLPTDG